MEKVKGKLHPPVRAAWTAGGNPWSVANQATAIVETTIDSGVAWHVRVQVSQHIGDNLERR